MRIRSYQWLAAGLLLFASACAQAAITCSVSSSGFSTAYDPLVTANVQTSFTVTCNRALGTDPTTISYSTTNNNGLTPNGVNNRAGLNGSYIRYDAFTNSSCGNQWKGATAIGGSMLFATTGPMSQTYNFWGCVPAGTTVAAGTYTDTVTMTLSYGPLPQSTASASYPVNIATPATCNTTAPGAVAFGSYLAFGGALAASTTFGATCTPYLPYTVVVSPTGGTIAGLDYTLLITPPAGPNGTSLSATGVGVLQTYTINGAMVAGQAGLCSGATCSGTVPHTLTLTY